MIVCVMTKETAANTVQNAGMTAYDIAHKIYLATVEGVSGANQNEGYGFALSAIAELWNIRGTIGNPSGRTKITGRYRGMGVTEAMILNAVSQYPQGIHGNQPLFDDLLGVGSSGRSSGGNQGGSFQTDTGGGNGVSVMSLAAGIVMFVILKFFLHWGWIISIILSFVATAIIEARMGQ